MKHKIKFNEIAVKYATRCNISTVMFHDFLQMHTITLWKAKGFLNVTRL